MPRHLQQQGEAAETCACRQPLTLHYQPQHTTLPQPLQQDEAPEACAWQQMRCVSVVEAPALPKKSGKADSADHLQQDEAPEAYAWQQMRCVSVVEAPALATKSGKADSADHIDNHFRSGSTVELISPPRPMAPALENVLGPEQATLGEREKTLKLISTWTHNDSRQRL
jgi:hypothetical protein